MPNTVSPGRSVFSPPLPLTSFLLSSILPYIITSLLPVFRIFFQVPYPATLLFATLTKTAGVCTNNSHSGTHHSRVQFSSLVGLSLTPIPHSLHPIPFPLILLRTLLRF